MADRLIQVLYDVTIYPAFPRLFFTLLETKLIPITLWENFGSAFNHSEVYIELRSNNTQGREMDLQRSAL